MTARALAMLAVAVLAASASAQPGGLGHSERQVGVCRFIDAERQAPRGTDKLDCEPWMYHEELVAAKDPAALKVTLRWLYAHGWQLVAVDSRPIMLREGLETVLYLERPTPAGWIEAKPPPGMTGSDAR